MADKPTYYLFEARHLETLQAIEQELYHNDDRRISGDRSRDLANYLNQAFRPSLEPITDKDMDKLTGPGQELQARIDKSIETLTKAAQLAAARHELLSGHKPAMKCDCNTATQWRLVVSAIGTLEGTW